jgi:hypothetical protein
MRVVIEKADGDVDGVNRVFRVNSPYVPGSVRVFRNGQLETVTLQDGWVEIGSQKVRLHEAPKPGDVISCYYLRA